MKPYEDYQITEITNLKRPTVYFFLKQNGISEHFIKYLRKTENSIKINGNNATLRSVIAKGDLLQILANPIPPNFSLACAGNLDILFEDDDFLIVNKPHNLSCIPTRSHISDNLGGRILSYMQKSTSSFVLRIKNRLDKDTAGIVVVAKNPIAYNKLTDLKKEYYALCEGSFEQENFTINKPILTISHNGINEMKRVVSEDGKRAITHVHIVKSISNDKRKNLSLTKLILETGRTHQIRVHLSSIGHSLYGDTLYGNQSPENHTFLLLKKIRFTHFRTGKEIDLEVPYPEDWNVYLQ